MKIFSKIIIVALLFTGCKKDDKTVNSLQGTWELQTSINGLSGQSTTYPKGNGDIRSFDASNYHFVYQGITKSGTYKVVKAHKITTNTEGNRIIFDGVAEEGAGIFVEVNGDMLTIGADGYDAGGQIYQRVSYQFQ